jgi:glutamate carboxypeptidase
MKSIELLNKIGLQKQAMISRLEAWAAINSGPDNLAGLALMLNTLESSFSSLNGIKERIALAPRSVVSSSGDIHMSPHGEALRITKRPHAPFQVFLGGHMDTVYSPSHPFQSVTIRSDRMYGPGVADMKGGLLIMLTALETLEKHPAAPNIGWEVVINPDEEIGSIGSEFLFREAAKRCNMGLIFEPSFADGAIVSARKGSMNFTIMAQGKAAHVGRDFDKGRNAILAVAQYIVEASRLNDREKGISISPGYICGGGPVNIVPDLAICRLNARAVHPNDFELMKETLENLANNGKSEGLNLAFHLENTRGPKLFDEKCHRLFEMINTCAKEEGYSLSHRPSGGVCDGNILAEEGVPVIDTLGAIGGEIHTADEYILIDSLVQRSRLVALFLIKLAAGELIA